MIDSEGSAIYSSLECRWSHNVAIGLVYMSSADNNKTSLLLDNVRCKDYEMANVNPVITQAPFESGSDAVALNTSKVSVTLDQAIDTSKSVATLTRVGGKESTCSIETDNSKPYTYTINLSTLEAYTTYTLDLSGLRNGINAAIGDGAVYTFTTEEGDLITELTEDHWYNALWTVDGNYETYTLTDSQTGEVVWSASKMRPLMTKMPITMVQ